jgi:hypothetical protein
VSPSWIKRWMGRLAAHPESTVGIAIGSRAVCAVLLSGDAGSHEMRAMETRELAKPLFGGASTAADEASLTEALRAVSEAFRGRFAAVRVALPDTVIRGAVFDLDELPKTENLRGALLRWRFAKEWQRPEEALECRGAALGEDGGKYVYFGQAGDRPWLGCVKGALAGAGIVPWSLNAAAVCRFNCFHDDMTSGGGALLALDAECWNLQLWDAAGRVRRVLTRLRVAGAAEYDAIVNAVERAILAYVHEGGGRAVDRLYLTADEAEVQDMAAAFNGRLREGAIWLRPDAKVAGTLAGMRAGLAPLALAAALGG